MLPASSSQTLLNSPSNSSTTTFSDFLPNIPSCLPSNEKFYFADILQEIPDEKKIGIPKREKQMAEFIREIYNDTIKEKVASGDVCFENDEPNINLRRRKVGFYSEGEFTKKIEDNMEIYVFGIDDSIQDKICKFIGGTTLKKDKSSRILIKSGKNVHEVMKKCESCRLILWVCSKDEKVLQHLLICKDVYPVYFDKAERDAITRKKTKTSQSSSSNGVDASGTNTDQTNSAVQQVDTIFQNLANVQSVLNQLKNKIIDLESIVKEQKVTINELSKIGYNLNEEKRDLNKKIAELSTNLQDIPEESFDWLDDYEDNIADIKELGNTDTILSENITNIANGEHRVDLNNW